MMAIDVMTIEPTNKIAGHQQQAEEVARRLNAWLSDRPGTRILNVETLLVRNAHFSSPYDGETMLQLVRVWYEMPSGQ
jgi:hypothetical protein